MTDTFTYTPLHKVVWAGEATDGKVFVEIRYSNQLNPTRPPTLSLSGVVGPYRNGNCKGSCGQIVHVDEPWRPTGDLTGAQLSKLIAIWDRWHLNGMRAGSPRQEEWLRNNPVTAVYPASYYDMAVAALNEAGLQPDAEHLIDGRPYSYGSAWLHEELPDEVLDFLRSLPECSITYPWQAIFDRNTP